MQLLFQKQVLELVLCIHKMIKYMFYMIEQLSYCHVMCIVSVGGVRQGISLPSAPESVEAGWYCPLSDSKVCLSSFSGTLGHIPQY